MTSRRRAVNRAARRRAVLGTAFDVEPRSFARRCAVPRRICALEMRFATRYANATPPLRSMSPIGSDRRAACRRVKRTIGYATNRLRLFSPPSLRFFARSAPPTSHRIRESRRNDIAARQDPDRTRSASFADHRRRPGDEYLRVPDRGRRLASNHFMGRSHADRPRRGTSMVSRSRDEDRAEPLPVPVYREKLSGSTMSADQRAPGTDAA